MNPCYMTQSSNMIFFIACDILLDYIGFVKRILNLLNTHKDVRKLELEMRPARPGDEDEAYILRTRIVPKTISIDETGPSQEDQRLLKDGRAAAGGQITNGRTGKFMYL